MEAPDPFREAAVAGLFYPADPRVLSRRINQFLEGEPSLPDPGPIGLVAPHAGYDYSGPTAGRAYRELRGRPPEVVVVVGPSHQDLFSGATYWPGAGYRTPLGEVRHPEEIVEALIREERDFHPDRCGHRDEHSVEVQIPFLQEIATEAPVLPLVLAQAAPETCARIGAILARIVGRRRALFVASSDLYHGHSVEDCRRTDRGTLEAIERNDPQELADGFHTGRLQACGRGPILVVLEACRRLGAERVRVLGATNSDEVAGRSGGYVVGYAAIGISHS